MMTSTAVSNTLDSEGRVQCGRETLSESETLSRYSRSTCRKGWPKDGRFSCEYCLKIFTRADGLKAHMGIHTGLRPYKCPHCETVFHVLSHLKSHVAMRHDVGRRKCICSSCGKSLSCQTALRRHGNICGRDFGERIKFKCEDCGKGFVTLEGYEKHQTNTTCSSVSTSRHNLQHIYTVAGASPSQDASRQHGMLASTLPSQDANREHGMLASTLPSQDASRQHGMLASTLPSQDANREHGMLASTLPSQDANREHGMMAKKTLICSTCSKTFEELTALDCHQRFLCGLREDMQSFRCPECQKAFSKRSLYIVHARFHSHDRPYRCQHCTARFITQSAMQRHMGRHTETQNLHCPLCDISYKTRDSLKMHVMRIHCGMKPFKCNECDSDFVHVRQLSNHIRRIHRKERPYKCVLCGKCHFEAYEWRKHMLEHVKTATAVIARHAAKGQGLAGSVKVMVADRTGMMATATDKANTDKANTDGGAEQSTAGTETSTEKTSVMSVCDEKAAYSKIVEGQLLGISTETSAIAVQNACVPAVAEKQSSCTRVIISSAHSNFVLPPASSVLGSGASSAASATISPSALITFNLPESTVREILGNSLKSRTKKETKKKLQSGEISRAGKQPAAEYPCSLCGQTHTMKRLEQHIKAEHSAVPDALKLGLRQVCSICLKETPTPSAMYQHKMVVHVRAGQLTCPHCNKVFSLNARLKRHLTVHSSQMPFQCHKCPTAFKWKVSLEEHLADIHNPDVQVGEDGKRFTCLTCGKRFARSSMLKTHRQLHQDTLPCICAVCGKGFISNTRLRVHMSAHNDGSDTEGNRPHVCRDCGKGYFYAHLLRRHVVSRHTDNRHWVCNICGKALTSKFSLKEHMRLHIRQPNKAVGHTRARTLTTPADDRAAADKNATKLHKVLQHTGP